MNNVMQVFNNASFGSIRVIEEDGEPWFVAKDVCEILGVRTNNLRSILDEDEIATINDYTIDIGGNAGVSESNEDSVHIGGPEGGVIRLCPLHNGEEANPYSIGVGGESHITRTPKVTGKGQIYFINMFKMLVNSGLKEAG